MGYLNLQSVKLSGLELNFGLNNLNSSLLLSQHSEQTKEILGNKIIKSAWELDPYHPSVKQLHKQLREMFSKYIKSPFAIVNSRAWLTFAGSTQYGPSAAHTDGFESGHLKIMLYPEGLNEEGGCLVIGDTKFNDFPPGTCVAFRNSDVLHRAVPGKKKDRLCVEITLQRTFTHIDQFSPSHFNGRHYSDPLHAYYYSESKSNFLPHSQTRLINIGSGIRDWKNWLLLDEITHPYIFPFKSSVSCSLPANTESADIIYTSHHIEHISNETLERLLQESYRVLEKGGYLILKYPDYDWFIQQYRSGDLEFMNNKGVESVLWSWSRMGVADNIENRLAMMIVGYWNTFYGDHFSGKIEQNKNAYHGPAKVDQDKLKNLLLHNSASEICKYLKNIALLDPNFKSFNHQAAWSNSELSDLVCSFGFKNLSFPKAYTMSRFGNLIPDLTSMESWSAFQVFTK